MSLCLNFHAVFKSEPYIVFIINSSVVHKAAPQLFVKFGKQVILLAKGVEEGINRTESCLLIGDFFGNRSMASLGKVLAITLI